MKKIIFILVGSLGILPACGHNSAASSQNPTAAEKKPAPVKEITSYDLYNLKTPVKEMKEWVILVTDLAENPGLKPNNPDAVEAAIEAGVLEEMTTSITTYKFAPDSKVADWVVSYSGKTPTEIINRELPGTFKVTYENGRPTQFLFNDERYQQEQIPLDFYEMGLENYTVKYDANGMPVSLSGTAMPFFNGGEYTETYSDYKFDEKGNWVSRKETTPYDTQIRYRSYVY